MLKGLTSAPKPFLKSIILESTNKNNFQNKSQVDLYYDNPDEDLQSGQDRIRITLDFYIKALASYSPNNFTINVSLKNILTQSSLFYIPILSKQEMTDFVKLSEAQKKQYISQNATKAFHVELKNFFNGKKIQDYISIVSPKSFQDKQQRMLTIPVQSDFILPSTTTPDFLGFIYYLAADFGNQLAGFVENSIGSEIIFDNQQIVTRTGYFIIDTTFKHNGQEQILSKTEIPTNLDLIDPATGESILPNVPTDRNQQVNYLYGAPDDIWTGPIHFHKETNQNSPNFGEFRAMAGAQHDNTIPHPFLRYIVRGNSKIIDFRGMNAFEDLFSYKSSIYEAILAASSNVLYTGQKKNKLIDDFIKNKAIVSELKYSIRTGQKKTQLSSGSQVLSSEYRSPALFFSIDKESLLKYTTKVPNFLDKVVGLKSLGIELYDAIIQNIDIISFQIIRINKRTKTSDVLIIAPNDQKHIVLSEQDNNGSNITNPMVFVNKTSKTFTPAGNENNTTCLYEFFDGQIDAIKDNGKYAYKIKLKYKDPVMSYLNDRLEQLRTIIANLDELSQKTNFMIPDPLTGKFVAIYDRFQKELNPTFVQQTINGSVNPLVPLSFSFDKQSELPDSVNSAFPIVDPTGASLLDSLSTYLVIINSYFFTGTEQNYFSLIDNIRNFIRSSLTLSVTTPELIEKTRSLLDIIRARTEDLLTLYSTEQVVKKSSGFTDKDYIQSTNVKNKSVFVVEYEHEFKNVLDLSKTKNAFDWVEPMPALENISSSPLKPISVDSYKQLVKGNETMNYLTLEGKDLVGKDNDYSYSFMNMFAPSILKYEKTDETNFDNNYLRAIRNKLIQNITNTPKSVLIPEILGTFGIKFPLKQETVTNYLQDKLAYDKDEIPSSVIGNSTQGVLDNFGSPFVISLPEAMGAPGKSDAETLAYGSVDSKDYEWTGGPFEDYPYNTAISLVNLINTNVYQRRSLKYLNQTYAQLVSDEIILDTEFNTANKNVPHTTNVFSTANVANLIQPSVVRNYLLYYIFSLITKNALFEHYDTYSYYLNIFAKVHYLHGFKQRDIGAFANRPSKFSFFTQNNNNFIKAMDFRELTPGVLNSLLPGQQLLCKIVLFEGEDITPLFDEKVINLFKDFYNLNELFLIGAPTDLSLVDQLLDGRTRDAIDELNNVNQNPAVASSNSEFRLEQEAIQAAVAEARTARAVELPGTPTAVSTSGFEGDEAIGVPATRGAQLDPKTEIEIIKKVIKNQQAVKSPMTGVKEQVQLPRTSPTGPY
tara:strand:- start:7343 stop:11149 length:3807 start_codon:yes stop_codon:yes gene_type:complete